MILVSSITFSAVFVNFADASKPYPWYLGDEMFWVTIDPADNALPFNLPERMDIFRPFTYYQFLDGFKLESKETKPLDAIMPFDEYYDVYVIPTASQMFSDGVFDADPELAQTLLEARIMFDDSDVNDYAGKDEISLIILFNRNELNFNQLSYFVSQIGGSLESLIDITPIATVTVPRSDIVSFANLARNYADIKFIEMNSFLELHLDESVDMVFEHGNELGGREWVEEHLPSGIETLDGTGVTIAILDSGIQGDKIIFPIPPISFINKDLDDLDDDLATDDPKILYSVDVYGGSLDRDDKFGHGTHVASIAAGTGELSDGKFVGVAPGANLFNFKVINNYGELVEEEKFLIALDLAVKGPDGIIQNYNDPDNDGADVISMSFGKPESLLNSMYYDSMVYAVENVVNTYNIVVVISAGNEGPDYDTVRSPARAPSAITVGNIDKEKYLYVTSSRGPSPYPNFADFSQPDGLAIQHIVKPEVVAPGTKICAARVAGSILEDDILEIVCDNDPQCLIDDYLALCTDDGMASKYIALTGTSMSAPHVAGAVALIRQLHPDWTANQVKSALVQTAEPLGDLNGDYDVFEQGGGLINIGDAIRFGGEVIPAVFNAGIHAWGNSDPIEFFFIGSNYNQKNKDFGLKIKAPTAIGIDNAPPYQYGGWKVSYFDTEINDWEPLSVINGYQYCLLNQDVTDFKIEHDLSYSMVVDRYSTRFEIEYYEFCDFTLPEPTQTLQIPLSFVLIY